MLDCLIPTSDALNSHAQGRPISLSPLAHVRDGYRGDELGELFRAELDHIPLRVRQTEVVARGNG